MNSEVKEILENVPRTGGELNQSRAPNAYIYVDEAKRLCIFPKEGGWLGVDINLLEGDLAPFSD